MQYLEAGADVLISSSYQATIPGFLAKGISPEEAEELLQRSVKLALEARDEFWKSTLRMSKPIYNRALVAASIGSYGAYLGDGSEYSGSYGTDVTMEKLKDFHRRRLQVLASAGTDLIAFEAIPNKMEAQASVELLDEENIQVPSWICFSSVDGKYLCSGEGFGECLEMLNRSEKVNAVGVNCPPPQFIENIICEFKNKRKRQLQCIQTVVKFGIPEPRGGCHRSALAIRVSKCLRKDGMMQVLVLLEDAAERHLQP